MSMELDIEVVEVDFHEFERRKMPRGNISWIETQNKTFLTSIFSEEEAQAKLDLAMEVNEVPFGHFERRKTPR